MGCHVLYLVKYKLSDIMTLFCVYRMLHEHMKQLSQIITPNHSDLRIPKMYHYECPWPAAQNEIYMINAYKVRQIQKSHDNAGHD